MAKILVIDDSSVIKIKITSILEMEGHEVLSAEEGKTGIQLAKSNLPDLILCDIMMPEMDGYQVFQELKKNKETSTIPFLFLSAKADKSDLRIGMNLGADDYLTKPFEIDDLLKAVDTQIKKKQTQDFLSRKKLEELRANLSLTLPHDLITPLTGILETTSQLKANIKKMPENSIQNMLEHIESSGNTLQRHIENFVLYTRLEIIAQNPKEIEKLQKAECSNPYEIIQKYIVERASNFDYTGSIQVNVPNVTIKIGELYFIKLISEIFQNFICQFKNLNGTIINATQKPEIIHITIEPQNPKATLLNENVLNETGLGIDIIKKIAQLHGGEFIVDKIEFLKMTVVLPCIIY
ncbi:MAG: response regulator [Leptospiraceae bacterium]|nr:response regulator [Leptospiraceae bacterium]